jgi:uncharacterized protein
MRIMIAGGSGLIGRALIPKLIEHGHKVIILSRKPGNVHGMPGVVMILQWDGKTGDKWAGHIGETDAVINLAGENLAGENFIPSRWTRKRKERLVKSRTNSNQALIKAIQGAEKKPAVFIQASGISYYGTKQDRELNEDSDGGNDFLANLSVKWEASSLQLEDMGIRRVVIRNGVVFSTQGGALPRFLLPYRLFVGGPFGRGQQVHSWIHIDDEVNAIRFLLENDRAQGIFNLTSPFPVTNDELGRTIARVLRRPHYFRIPGLLFKLLLGEVSTVVLEGQKVIPERLLNLDFKFTYPALFDALRDLVVYKK